MNRNQNNRGTRILKGEINPDNERTTQKVCCTYCSLEPGPYYGAEVTKLEGVQDRPFRTVPVDWGE